MEFKKALLRAASIFALTAGGQYSAHASIPPGSGLERNPTAASISHQDPLFALLGKTNGSFSGESVEAALREIFPGLSVTEVGALPGLLDGLSRLGASSDVVARATDVLIELVSNSSAISDDVIATVLSELGQ